MKLTSLFKGFNRLPFLAIVLCSCLDETKTPKYPKVAAESGDSCKFIFHAPPNRDEASLYSLQTDLQDILIISPTLAVSPSGQTAPVLQSYFRAYPSTKLLVLYLWTTNCDLCTQQISRLKNFLSALSNRPQVKVIALSESPHESEWNQYLKQNPFPASVLQNHVDENAPNGNNLCRTLYASAYRPLLLAVDREMVVRQALVYPFTEQRQIDFLDGISRLTQTGPELERNFIPAKLEPEVLDSELATRAAEAGLLHLTVKTLPPSLHSKDSSPIKVLFFSPRNEEGQENQLSLAPTIKAFNQTPHAFPTKMDWIESAVLPFKMPLVLILDQQNQIRLALLGPLTEQKQSQIYAELNKLVKFYQKLEIQIPMGVGPRSHNK